MTSILSGKINFLFPNSLPISKGLAQKELEPFVTTDPPGLTATIAPTVMPFSKNNEDDPNPPFKLIVVAPYPAPAVPILKALSFDA